MFLVGGNWFSQVTKHLNYTFLEELCSTWLNQVGKNVFTAGPVTSETPESAITCIL